MRVLKWIIDRCEGKVDAAESSIGWLPRAKDVDLAELDGVSRQQFAKLLSVEPDEWKKELENQGNFFETLQPDLPQELLAQHKKLAERLSR